MSFTSGWRGGAGVLLAVMVGGAMATACVSKGATNITTNASGSKKDDSAKDDAGEAASNPQTGDVDASTGQPSTPPDRDDESSSSEDDSDDEDPTATATSNDDETESDDPQTSPEPSSDDTAEEPTQDDDRSVSDDTVDSDDTTPDAASTAETEEPEPPPQPKPVYACSAEMNRVARGEAVKISNGDLVDKTDFVAVPGPGEHWVGWIDTSPSAPKLVSLTFEDNEASALKKLALEDDSAPTAAIAAAYSAEAGDAGAYAVSWLDAAGTRMNWVSGEAWVEAEAKTIATGVPFWGRVEMAYNGDRYGVHFTSNHAYLADVSEAGSADVGAAGESFPGIEARDVVVDADGHFVTFGRYHDGSVSSFWNAINTFDGDTRTQATLQGTPIFGTYPFNTPRQDSGPNEMQLAWDGAAVGLAYGESDNDGVHYAQVTTAGSVVFDEIVTDDGQLPLDLYFDVEANLMYLLSSDGADVYITAFSPEDGIPVIESRLLVSGEGVVRGYLLYDEGAERLRAYYASGAGVHQIFTTLVECNEP